jgi:signal transduction histidine kinase
MSSPAAKSKPTPAATHSALEGLSERLRWNSLAKRLFASAIIWSLVALPATGLVLHSMFRAQVERDFDQRLLLMVTLLVPKGNEARTPEPTKPEDMPEPLFNYPLTGWYWQITPADKKPGPTLVSQSLATETFRLPRDYKVKPDQAGFRWANIPGPDDKLLRVVEFEQAIGDGQPLRRYSYAVAGPREEIDTDLRKFRNMVLLALSVLGAGLLVATAFQVRFGLRPLGRIERGLAAIRSGEAQQLDGELPDEIKPLQQELNALIRSNQDVVERARTQVGNLAHALKTPLSVITNEARDSDGAFARKVTEQASIMREQINHYLDRARAAARIGTVSGVAEVGPVIAGLQRALTRIYGDDRNDKPIKIEVVCPPDARFRGERQDLEEMLGNLMDNGCKWARSRVRVTVIQDRPASKSARSVLVILIEDDGPGLTPEQCAEVGKRGRRLDESKPGSGLGLSIVADLAGLYHGRLELARSEIGGLHARLDLPAA